jgi:integrase
MVWTPAQIGQFLDHIADHRLYALYHLIAFRGLRRGEACGLRWEDVNLDEGHMSIVTEIVQLGWEAVESTPKTDASDATVALDKQSRRRRARGRRSRRPRSCSWARRTPTAAGSSRARTGQSCTRISSPTCSSGIRGGPACRPSGCMTSATARRRSRTRPGPT